MNLYVIFKMFVSQYHFTFLYQIFCILMVKMKIKLWNLVTLSRALMTVNSSIYGLHILTMKWSLCRFATLGCREIDHFVRKSKHRGNQTNLYKYHLFQFFNQIQTMYSAFAFPSLLQSTFLLKFVPRNHCRHSLYCILCVPQFSSMDQVLEPVEFDCFHLLIDCFVNVFSHCWILII